MQIFKVAQRAIERAMLGVSLNLNLFQMPVKLYKLDLSPPVRAVIMLCDIYKVPLELIDVDLRKGEHRTPEYLKLNPLHTVPTLVDGDIVLNDSHAILIYLSEVYGKNDTLYSKDAKQRALINQKLFFNVQYLFPRMRNVTYPIFMFGKKGIEQKFLDDVEEVYGFLEEFLSRTQYLAGNNLTIADIAAFPSVNGLVYILPMDAKRYPKTTAWFKLLEQKPYSQKHNAAPAKALGEVILSAIKQ